ncbi:hypothetical protein [Leptospirillum ferriphilum]|uniref:hypothetical protein n=1 Tax=Leptospirillum ferriphilum TaxID=178606 RepID=UPI0006B2054E|nr:hypothetical protein [Leptospirillum ferriphilum]
MGPQVPGVDIEPDISSQKVVIDWITGCDWLCSGKDLLQPAFDAVRPLRNLALDWWVLKRTFSVSLVASTGTSQIMRECAVFAMGKFPGKFRAGAVDIPPVSGEEAPTSGAFTRLVISSANRTRTISPEALTA